MNTDEAKVKDYVLSRAFDPLMSAVDKLEIDEDPLVDGLSFTHDELRGSWYSRIPWSEFVTYCARLEEQAGSEVIDDMGRFLSGAPSFQAFLRVAGRMANPRWYYHMSKHWFGPTLFPPVSLSEYDEIGPRTLRVILQIPDELADCPQFFRLTAALDRHGPEMLGMKPASVRLELQPRRGIYTIVYPPSPSITSRIKRAVSAAFSSDTLMEEYRLQHDKLMKSFEAEKRSESSFRHLVDGSPDAMMVFAESGIHHVNDAMAELLGAEDPQRLVGRALDSVCSDPEALIDQAQSGDDDAEPAQCIFFGGRNRQFPGEVSTISAYFEGQRVYVSIVRDVSTRNEMLTRAMEMDRIISMGMLAAGVSHEVNNPLAFIHTNLYYLRDLLDGKELDESDLEEARQALDDSLRGMDKIQRIVGDLNTFARAPQTHLEQVDINAALQPALRWIEPELRNRASLRCSLADHAPAWSDADRINQVVLNLLLNAAHAIEPGRPDENTVEVRTFTHDDRAVIEVCDTGPGIPEKIRHKIFDPFFTTKPAGQGTGLGLFLTQQIVDQLHGQLTVDSAPEQGTTIRLLLPTQEPAEG